MTYTVLEYRQAWRIINGAYFREAWVRTSDGAVRLYGIRDGRIGEMA